MMPVKLSGRVAFATFMVLATGCQTLFGDSTSSGVSGQDGGVCDKRYGSQFEDRTCDQGCVAGTHCVLATGACAWDCWGDSDCGLGGVCSCDGYCVAGPVVPEPGATGGACPRNESLLTGNSSTPPITARSCIRDETCAYGSHCDPVTRRCAYDCLDDQDCGAPGEVCSCRGVCEVPGAAPARPAEVVAQVTVTPAFLSVPSLGSWGRQTIAIELRAAEAAAAAGLHPRARVEVLDPDGLGHLAVVPSAEVAERVEYYAGVAFSTADQARAVDYLASATASALAADLGVTVDLAAAIVATRPLADLSALVAVAGVEGRAVQALKTRTQTDAGVTCPSTALVLDDSRWQVDAANGYVARASVSVGRCTETPEDAIAEVAISTYLVDDAGELVQHLDYRIVALGTDGAEVAPATPTTGEFAGRLVERVAGARVPLVVPVRAWATAADRLVILDELRLLAATGWFGLDGNGDVVAAVDPADPETEGVIRAVVSDWAERPAPAGHRAGSFVYALGGALRTFDVELQRTGDADDPLSGGDSELAQAALCSNDAACDRDHACATALGRCVPGSRRAGPLGDTLEDAREAAWVRGGAFLANYAADWASISQRIENLICSPEVGAGFLYSLSDETALERRSSVTGELACRQVSRAPNSVRMRSEHAPAAVGLVSGNERLVQVETTGGGMNTDRTPIVAQPARGGDWLAACVDDLRRAPPTVAGSTMEARAASWHQQGRPCIDLGQFFPALSWLVYDWIDSTYAVYVGRRQASLFQRLLSEWLDVHAFVLEQGLASDEMIDVLGADRTQPYPDRSAADPGELMALMERGWQVFMDDTYAGPLAQLSRDALARPDYRLPRPTAYWSFDAGDVSGRHVASVVGDYPLDLADGATVSYSDGALRASGPAYEEFRTSVLGPHRDLTVSFWIDVTNLPTGQTMIVNGYAGGSVLLERKSDTDRSWLVGFGKMNSYQRSAYQTTTGWVHIAARRVGTSYEIYRNGVLLHSGPVVGEPYHNDYGYTFLLDSDIPTWPLIVDDLAVWDQALSPGQIGEIYELRRSSASKPRVLLDWLERFDALERNPNHEQSVGLPVKLVETATKHAQVVESYARDQLAEVYEVCHQGGSSAPQQRALERAARSLRYVLAAESLATKLNARASARACTAAPECAAVGAAACVGGMCVAADGSPATIELSWSERYRLAQTELASARARTIDALAALERCDNPLGIPETAMPLYFGDVVGENGRFFASTDYLMSQWAEPTVRQASAALEAARTSWINQRDADVRQQLTEQDAERRLESLELRYMEPVVAACGITEYDALDVLEAFDDPRSGLRLATCFRKPGCRPKQDTRACLRGSIGDSLLSVNSAKQALTLEHKTVDKRLQEWEQQRGFCAFTEQSLFGDLTAMADYNEQAIELRKKGRGFMGWLQGTLESIPGVGGLFEYVNIQAVLEGCIAGQVGGVYGCLAGAAYGAAFGGGGKFDSVDEAKEALELTLAAGRAEREMAACWDELTTRQRDLFFQFNYVKQRSLDLDQALFRVDEELRTVARNLTEARAALAREAGRTVPSVAHHYWLGERIERFRVEMERARRFTFLTLRAAEYELQQSFGLRSRILTAQHPDDLLDVVYILDSARGTRTINNRRPAENTEVISLRTDVLGLADLQRPTAGERQDGATRRFANALMAPENAVYDRDGYYLGQGISFSLDAVGALKHRCAERLWRVTATLQGDVTDADEPGTHTFLLKRNVFQSQWCDGHGDGSDYQKTSTASASNLFLGDVIDPDAANTDFTPALIYPWFNVRRSELYRDQYTEGASEELAGRGLYGEYLLLFPYYGMLEPNASCQQGEPCADPFRDLRRIEDVLIRFDYASVDNLPI